MHVRIDQSGEQGPAPGVDHFRVRWDVNLTGFGCGRDSVPTDEDYSILDGIDSGAVDDPRVDYGEAGSGLWSRGLATEKGGETENVREKEQKKRFTDWHRIFLGRGAFAGTLNENIFSHNRIMSAGLSFFNGYLR
jgi:hypothetical protein